MSDLNENTERIYKIYRGYIEHEDTLINHRTTWLITIQSFLWATFGFSYQKKYEMFVKIRESAVCQNSFGLAPAEFNGFLFILAVVGFSTAFVSLISVSAAVSAIGELKKEWGTLAATWPDAVLLPKITGGGSRWASKAGIVIALALPIFFCAAWALTAGIIYCGHKLSFPWTY